MKIVGIKVSTVSRCYYCSGTGEQFNASYGGDHLRTCCAKCGGSGQSLAERNISLQELKLALEKV